MDQNLSLFPGLSKKFWATLKSHSQLHAKQYAAAVEAQLHALENEQLESEAFTEIHELHLRIRYYGIRYVTIQGVQYLCCSK